MKYLQWLVYCLNTSDASIANNGYHQCVVGFYRSEDGIQVAWAFLSFGEYGNGYADGAGDALVY